MQGGTGVRAYESDSHARACARGSWTLVVVCDRTRVLCEDFMDAE